MQQEINQTSFTKLHVKNYPAYWTTSRSLLKYFNEDRSILDATPHHSQHTNFAILTFIDHASALNFMDQWQGKRLRGRKLKVKPDDGRKARETPQVPEPLTLDPQDQFKRDKASLQRKLSVRWYQRPEQRAKLGRFFFSYAIKATGGDKDLANKVANAIIQRSAIQVVNAFLTYESLSRAI